MSMVGTFDSFTAARLGIYTAQQGLHVTGNNISNINTMGYTRQRADQYSFKVGANDMYKSYYDNHIGSGALVHNISQIRDPYLDIRYRNLSTETYHYDTWLSGLQSIASILDEVGKGPNDGDGMLYAQLQDLAEKLRTYGANPTGLNDRLVRNSATSLTALFHNAATRLESLLNETKKQFSDDLNAVNAILTNIRDLNKTIRDAEIHGDTALEMRDERNRQIDKLSQYLDITVQYSFEDVGGGVQVEKLTISLNNANPDSRVHSDESILVDGLYATQLSVPEEKPSLNLFDENSEYAYLNKYLYRREVAMTAEELDAFKTEKGYEPVAAKNADGTPKTDDDGNTIYLIGTNDPNLDGVVKETNDNYTIQLSKLLNAKGAEWKNSITRWQDVGSSNAPTKAVYTYPVELEGITDGILDGNLTFKIAGAVPEEYKVSDISKSVTQADFLAFVAKKLNSTGRYPDYTVSTDGKNIIFTANNPGKVGLQADVDRGAPKEPPKLSVSTADGVMSWIDLGEVEETKTGSLPDDDGYTEYDEYGNVTQTVSYALVENKWYRIQTDTEYTHEVTLDDNDLRGILQAEREMLTEEGEFASAKDLAIDENALIKRGIPYYQKSLDLLAQKFAEAYNKLNSGYAYNQNGYYIKEDGSLLEFAGESVSTDGLTVNQLKSLIEDNPANYADYKDYFLTDEDGYLLDANGSYILDDDKNRINITDLYVPEDPDDPGSDQVLNEAILSKVTAAVNMDKLLAKEEDGGLLGGYFMGGPLFSNRGDNSDPTGITAANISIAADWSNGEYGIIPTFMMLFSDDGSGGLTHSTQSDNASHMIAMIGNALTYDPRDLEGSDAIGPVLFRGSFNDMLGNMMAVQGEDADMTGLRLTNYATSLNEVDYSREGVSGVDLNDEAMNMVTYQKAMTAAMRLMTTIDEMLDRLINNTGIAGR